MGVPAAVIDGAVRISFGRDNTPEEIDRLKSRVARARGQLVRLRGGRPCGRCGAAAREDDRFCRSCGARL